MTGSQERWYEINPAGPSLFQSGTVSSGSLYVFNGAISTDRVVNGATTAFGDSMAMGFSTLPSSTFPAIQMVTKHGASAQSSMRMVTQSAGKNVDFSCFAPYGPPCRWGDYSGASSDPGASTSGASGQVWLANSKASSNKTARAPTPSRSADPLRWRLVDAVSFYDAIARVYDPWSRSVTEDVPFYLEEARRVAPGPLVELGVGTGRIAVPIAAEGIRVVGVDSSQAMLDVCRERARVAGVSELVELQLGDLRDPLLDARVPLVTCPFRSLLHLTTDADRLRALRSAHELLVPGGRLVFDVFTPSQADIAETGGRWLEREPGIFERADWDERRRTLTLSVRARDGGGTLALSWLAPGRWRELVERAGFHVEACYGWFDRRPWSGEEDTIWLARRG